MNASGTTFLFTGDISSEVENVLNKDGISDVDVLKTAHHGSGYSSSEEFLKASKAEMADYILRQKKQIRSSGAGNAGTDAECRYTGLYNNEDGSGDNALQKRKVSSTDMVEIRQKNVVHS